MSLRARVAGATALAVAAVLLVSGALLVARFSDAQWAAFDDSLTQRSDLLAEVIETADDVAPERLAIAVDGLDDGSLGDGLIARVTLPDGTTQEVGGFPDVGELPVGVEEVTDEDGTTWRVATEVVPGPGRFASASTSVAEPTADTEASIDRVRAIAVQTGVVAVALAALVGWLLARVSLRPLGRLRAEAGALAMDGDPGARIPEAPAPAEVSSLARTLNDLLDRIDAGDAERRAALDSARAFAADAAHELRNPLTAIRADLELLAGGHDLDHDEHAEVLAELLGLQGRVERTLEALRVVALSDLRGIPERTEVDLAALARSGVDAVLASAADDALEVTVAVAGDDAIVRGWKDGLELAVRNVIDNAARHGTGADGRTEVAVVVRGGTTAVEVVVSDTGRGLPEAERERLLRRFERGRDASGDGSGLGLAIADQQLRLHGGHLVLGEGHPGAVVTLMVPRTPPTPR